MKYKYHKKGKVKREVIEEKTVLCPITGEEVICKVLRPGPRGIKVPYVQPWRSANIKRRNRANGSR